MSAADKGAAGDPATRLYAAWERSASAAAEQVARDPRTLALGAGMMRSQLLFSRAIGLMWEAALAPLSALADGERA